MSDFNFNQNISGGQVNQGNITIENQTYNAGGLSDKWVEARQEVSTEDQGESLESIIEVVECYSEEPESIPDEELTRLERSLSFLREHGPSIARIAGKTALSFIPAGNAIYTLIDESLKEISE